MEFRNRRRVDSRSLCLTSIVGASPRSPVNSWGPSALAKKDDEQLPMSAPAPPFESAAGFQVGVRVTRRPARTHIGRAWRQLPTRLGSGEDQLMDASALGRARTMTEHYRLGAAYRAVMRTGTACPQRQPCRSPGGLRSSRPCMRRSRMWSALREEAMLSPIVRRPFALAYSRYCVSPCLKEGHLRAAPVREQGETAPRRQSHCRAPGREVSSAAAVVTS